MEQRQLRPHQETAIEMLRESIKQGKHRPILAAPCSFGKTTVASYLIQSAVSKGKRCGFIVDRVELLDQAGERFFQDGIDYGIMQGDHPMTDPRKQVQIATIQTLNRRKMQDFDFLIADECFVEGTLVDTPKGKVAIEFVTSGDLVYNAIGIGEVLAVSAKPSKEIHCMEFDDGTTVKCTGNHPFFTWDGWRSASVMEVGSIVAGREAVQGLWRDDVTVQKGIQEREGDSTEQEIVDKARMLRAVLREEIQKPNVQQRNENEAFINIKKDRSQTENSWREWQRANGSAKNAMGEAGGWVGNGVHSFARRGKGGWRISNTLQARHSAPTENDSYRGGWIQSSTVREEKARQEKGLFFGWKRLVSVSVEKLTSDRVVYNMQVSGHPSYYANGLLVHNCHTLHQAHIKYIEAFNAIPIIGLSATPFTKGLGKYFNNLIVPITTGELIEQGYLAKYEVYAPSEPDLEGVKIKRGDYDENELEERCNKPKLIGDIVKTHQRLAKGRATVVFAVSIAHSKHIVEEFRKVGVKAVHVDAYTDKDTRKLINDQFKSGEIDLLSCVAIFEKGWDAPITSCAILAAPTKSVMRYVQQVGRILRTHPGKDKSLILDHAGNTLRHGWVEEIIPERLDTGTKNEAEVIKREKKKKEPSKCQKCGYVKEGLSCPVCGFAPSITRNVETIEGELGKKEKKKTVTIEEKKRWYAMLLGHAQARGYKSGWAYHKLVQKFGESVRDTKIIQPAQPDLEVMNWIKHMNIREAKGRQKYGARG